MKPIKDDLLDLGGIIGSLLDLTKINLDNSKKKSTVSLPLSQREIKAFEGLCDGKQITKRGNSRINLKLCRTEG